MMPEEIKKLRESIGENYTAFAGRVGVSENTIRRWENGTVSPGLYYVAKMRRIRAAFTSLRTRGKVSNG